MNKKLKQRILKFIPLGHRYIEYPVTREQERLVLSEQKEETYRLYKLGSSWSGEKGDLFLGREGSPITSVVKTDPDGGEQWMGLMDFLREIWGQKQLNSLPEELAGPLRDNWMVEVTVAPAEVDGEAQPFLDVITANELLFESNLVQAAAVGKATEEVSKIAQIMAFLMPFAIGAFFMYFIVKQGII